MPLPTTINTQTIREATDDLDQEFDTDAIDDAIEPYLEELVERLTNQFKLSEEQAIELEERLCWRWELLPPQA